MLSKAPFKYLIAYCAYAQAVERKYERLLERHRSRGFDLEGFCLTPASVNRRRWLAFNELDRLWKTKDTALLSMYDALEEKLRSKDIFVVFNGANIHPDFLRHLSTFNVYLCWDDPESSEILSRPVAAHFDFCFTGNASCVPLYQSWGISRVAFLPILFFTEEDYDARLTEKDILEGDRDVDLVYLGEMNARRRCTLERLRSNFPQSLIRGRGWPDGYLPEEEKIPLYRRSKIGWNVHNSVGPCNIRTFALPASGILQICDNKCRFGQLFELGMEAIGFDRVEECIDLTRYYLEHDDERRALAAAGWRRVTMDYNEAVNWQRMVDAITPHVRAKLERKPDRVAEGKGRVPRAESGTGPLGLAAEKMITPKRWIRKMVNRFGYDIVRMKKDAATSELSQADGKLAYLENPEIGPVNWKEKEKRAREGGFLEWPNIVALNYAVASLVGSWKEIVEIGGGTGVFAYEVSADSARRVVCSEDDEDALTYATRHRWRPNITYTSEDVASLSEKFELVVGVDVIEHVKDFRPFLDMCSRLAPNAIFTTPNKNREGNADRMSGPPAYYQHVREWTAGEIYWVLRAFYKDVDLYSMPNPYIPSVIPVDVACKLTPMIAVCQRAIAG